MHDLHALTAHIKPTVRTAAQPWRPLMWGCHWNTNERGIAQRGTSRCIAIRRNKYQRGGEWRTGTKCCFRLLKVKANQSWIPQKYCRILKLNKNQEIIISLIFLLILDWIRPVQCTVPVCVSPLPQSGSSVWVSWLVYYTPAGIFIWLALCPHLLGSVPGCYVQTYAPSHTNSDDDNHMARRNAGECSCCPCCTFSYSICLCAILRKNTRPLSESVYVRNRWHVCVWNIPDH